MASARFADVSTQDLKAYIEKQRSARMLAQDNIMQAAKCLAERVKNTARLAAATAKSAAMHVKSQDTTPTQEEIAMLIQAAEDVDAAEDADAKDVDFACQTESKESGSLSKESGSAGNSKSVESGTSVDRKGTVRILTHEVAEKLHDQWENKHFRESMASGWEEDAWLKHKEDEIDAILPSPSLPTSTAGPRSPSMPSLSLPAKRKIGECTPKASATNSKSRRKFTHFFGRKRSRKHDRAIGFHGALETSNFKLRFLIKYSHTVSFFLLVFLKRFRKLKEEPAVPAVS
jgi:hypothetical protein